MRFAFVAFACAVLFAIIGAGVSYRGHTIETTARLQRTIENRAVLVRLCEATKAHDAADADDSTKLAKIDEQYATTAAAAEFKSFLQARSKVIVSRALRFKALADVDCSKLASGS